MTTAPADPRLRTSSGSEAGAAARDRFPPGIPFIIGNEGAERFSYYGMRQILFIYLSALYLRFVDEAAAGAAAVGDANVRATQVAHLFMGAVYGFPIIGAVLADRLLGKYRVIFWVSLIYCLGHGVLAVAGRYGAIGNFGAAELGMGLGLGLIALGSGGIKPCVSANVGDQFTKENGHLVDKVFQIFYFIINFGSFFASIITPYLYKRVGPEVAFGVPGILMCIAAVIFWKGRDRFVKVPPKPGGRLGALDLAATLLLFAPLFALIWAGKGAAKILMDAAMADAATAKAGDIVGLGAGFAEVAAVYWPAALAALAGFAIGLALFRLRQSLAQDSGFLSVLVYSFVHRSERGAGEGFFAPARAHFGDEAAEGPPAVLRIMLVFSMVAFFWALFEQHSSSWVRQAAQMDLAFDAPTWLWWSFAVPATVVAAVCGAVWLFRWVGNRPLPRRATVTALAILGLWAAAAVVLQLVRGGSSRIEMLPAQISAMNPLLVMIIIPLLNVGVYEPLARKGRPLVPLARMAIGMFLTALSFVAVALLQQRIDTSPAGSVHVFWQVIPYFIITIAEVLVSVTGLAFAYTQAPRPMKSTIMGFWLLCNTLGQILVVFLAPLQRLSLAYFFWVFAALMAAAAAVFSILAKMYRGKTYLQAAAH